MEILIWLGALISLMGVAGLFYCVYAAMQLRKSADTPEAQRRGMQKVVAINMAALGVSAIGLMLVVTGILLK